MSENKKMTVKARRHYGSKSLDLTIPVSLGESLAIKDGDVFVVEAETQKEQLILHYRRIYAQK
jgi:hypothetical protein